MLVHGVETREHVAEVFRSDRQHGGQPDRRVHGVAPPDPVPEFEHVGGVDAELADLAGVGGDRHEVLRHRLGVPAQRRQRPVAGAVRVRHGLQGGESLRGHDEQRLDRIQAAHRLGEVGSIDVGDEAECHVGRAVVAQRLVCHHRPQVRPADADVDHVADALARVPLPGAPAHAVRELAHFVEHGVDAGHHVLAVDHDGRAFRGAQRDVQNGPML